MLKRSQYTKVTAGSGGGDATAANQLLEIDELTAINTKLLAQATAANQTTEISYLEDILNNILPLAQDANLIACYNKLIDINNSLIGKATDTNQVTEINELISINTKLLAQATANGQLITNSTLATISNNISTQLTLLQTQNRFNNGLTSTSFSASSIALLNTAIQTFITANPLRQFKSQSITQQGGTTIAILIHSL